MDTAAISTMEECARGSYSGALTFPQIVGKLATLGVERYHVDYVRHEITYYLTSGESYVAATPSSALQPATEFAAEKVEQAVRQSQRGEHSYVDFVCKTLEAGCVGYFVQIGGRRAIYFGRSGDTHVEFFPDAAD